MSYLSLFWKVHLITKVYTKKGYLYYENFVL